jgi:exopolysaccharide biosynthesis polyprenyl glycosylphosphotransferase
MANETHVTEPAGQVDSEGGSASAVEQKAGSARFRRAAADSVGDGGSGFRIANGKSADLEHHDVRRDVRAPRPQLLGTLVRAQTLGRLGRLVSLLALDLGALWAAIFSALALKELIKGNFVFEKVSGTTWEYLPFVFLVTALLFARSRLYGPREVRPGLTAIVAGLFWVAVVSLVFALVNGLDFQSYYVFYGGLFLGVVWVGGLRWLYEKATGLALAALGRRRRAILVGSGHQIEAVARALSADGSPTPYEPIGYISLTPRPENGLRDLGRLEDLPRLLEDHSIHEVIIADPDFPQEEAFELVDRCHERGVAVRIAPTTMEIMTHEHQLVPGQTVPLFELKPPVFEGVDFVIKRTFDVVGAALLLVALSPLLGSIAFAIKLTSRGPVLFRSRRPGIGGQPFDCLKFRTMHSRAERSQAELERRNEASGPLFKMRSDPRLTQIGGFLRRFSLDELPQLVNVLRGEMSLVGPRPLPQRDYDRLEDWHRKRYLVLPGITGLWQVSGRAELDFDELVRLDFLYLERWSVFLDLSILLKTVPAVFTRKGAF